MEVTKVLHLVKSTAGTHVYGEQGVEARRLVDDVYEMVQERSMVLDLAKRCTITEYRS